MEKKFISSSTLELSILSYEQVCNIENLACKAKECLAACIDDISQDIEIGTQLESELKQVLSQLESYISNAINSDYLSLIDPLESLIRNSRSKANEMFLDKQAKIEAAKKATADLKTSKPIKTSNRTPQEIAKTNELKEMKKEEESTIGYSPLIRKETDKEIMKISCKAMKLFNNMEVDTKIASYRLIYENPNFELFLSCLKEVTKDKDVMVRGMDTFLKQFYLFVKTDIVDTNFPDIIKDKTRFDLARILFDNAVVIYTKKLKKFDYIKL